MGLPLDVILNFVDFYHSLQMKYLTSDLLSEEFSPKQISNAVAMAVKITKSSGIGIQKHFMPVYSAMNQEIIEDCKLSRLGYGLVLMHANSNLSVVGDFQVNLIKEFLKMKN